MTKKDTGLWEIPEIPRNIENDTRRRRQKSLALVVGRTLDELRKWGQARMYVDRYYCDHGILGYEHNADIILSHDAPKVVAKLFTDRGYYAYLSVFGKGILDSSVNGILWISCSKIDRTSLRTTCNGFSGNYKGTYILYPDEHDRFLSMTRYGNKTNNGKKMKGN